MWGSVICREADTAHAGVQLDVNGLDDAGFGGQRVEFFCGFHAEDGGRQVVFQHPGQLLVPGVAQQQNGTALRACAAQLGALFPHGNGKMRDAAGAEGGIQSGGTVAVAVGLDHGDQLRAGVQTALDVANVVRQAAQRNGRPGSALNGHGVNLVFQ